MLIVSLALPLLLLLAGSPLQAESSGSTSLRTGADISAFRSIAGEGLSSEQRFEAYGRFMASYPRSPLAEVALVHCLELGGDLTPVLAELNATDRTYLVSNFRSHHDLLLTRPQEGPALTDAAEPAPAAEPRD